ncbi:LysR family transcriptional regulator [Leeia aquatica]|uniref:LysR family transcriptional regulator n=1 Tax=Leeia aquatica TaxID=2725557 RepID=A0A847SK17_9NEIS|nr:LysR family transcriptional regulator [Leeia aquatica]NLR76262.1 LysR family transcriptional regulator [Leeia aquatica]
MHAKTQYKLNADDLILLLALVRAGKLAQAGERLGVDASTVFRSIQRIERGLGCNLFVRSRQGYAATELALQLAEQAEQIEMAIETARSSAQQAPEQLSGSVRLTTTDTLLHGLVAPALLSLRQQHPLLAFELHTGNELASLTRRDADLAVRATRQPPSHLVGRRLGPIRVALYAPAGTRISMAEACQGQLPWITPDDALPEHPSVRWRRKHYPRLQPTYRVNSIQSVQELVLRGLGVGILPCFLANPQPGLQRLSDELPECQTDLWLLTHAESRHQRRVAVCYAWLAEQVKLP